MTCLVVGLLLAATASAQTIEASADALARAKREAVFANQRSAALDAQAARATTAAAKARAAEAAVEQRIESAKQDIAAARARIRIVEALRMKQRARLAEEQGPIVRLLAAIQVMARRPPALAIVQPGSIADVVHVRALLASRIPLVRARTAGLRAAVAEGVRLRAQADQAVATLRAGGQRLMRERAQLARLEASHRLRSQAFTDDALHESDRAIALGEEARDIVDLMGEEDERAARRARLATLPGPVPRPPLPGEPAAPAPDPRPPFTYRLPVTGRLLTGLGEISDTGIRSRGLTIATASRAQVVAPAHGRIAYAGPFRRYGRIVIIDHGGGMTSAITNLAMLGVKAGDTVDRNDPIGRAGETRPTVTVELSRNGRPVDITPLILAPPP